MPQASTPRQHMPQPSYVLARHNFLLFSECQVFWSFLISCCFLISWMRLGKGLDALSLFSDQKTVHVSKPSLSTNFSMNISLPAYPDLYPMPLSSQILYTALIDEFWIAVYVSSLSYLNFTYTLHILIPSEQRLHLTYPCI